MAGTRQTPAAAASSSNANTSSTTSDERDLFKCPTFDGKNFPIWQRKVKTYLAVKSLMKCIEEPLPPNASEQAKLEYVRAAAIISGHIEDDIYNHIITDENVNDAFALWKELKGEYASASVLAIYHAWRKWEDIQYNNDINRYITQLES
ncbi:hypothetical protein PTTG_31100, partial [Puccinia triticina 1-1 BBBD Race 1]